VVLTLAPVASERLTLPLWDAATVAAIRSGDRLEGWHRDFPREDDRDAATLWRDGDPWGPRSIELDRVVVGSIGFFGPPAERDGTPEAEVGYGLVGDARGHGAATEALRGLLALTDRGGVRVRASVLPDNAASIRVLAKCGFTELRGANEDGELVMARPIPSA
jgi:RimJ/RimL family protein N-acetyltransferase